MLDIEKQNNINLLEDELFKLNYLLKSGHCPYVFVVSNEKYIREHFENLLSEMTDLIIPLDDYDLSSTKWVEDLKKNNLLLLNIIDKEKELENRVKNRVEKNNSFIVKNSAFYYCLVMPRELIAKTGHGFVMVSDDNLISKILNDNQSVASCSHIFFLDDTLEEKKKLIAKQQEKDEDCWEK